MPARIILAKKAAEAVAKRAPRATSRIAETARNVMQQADDAVRAIGERRSRRSSNQEGPYLDVNELNAARREPSKVQLALDTDGVIRAKPKPKPKSKRRSR